MVVLFSFTLLCKKYPLRLLAIQRILLTELLKRFLSSKPSASDFTKIRLKAVLDVTFSPNIFEKFLKIKISLKMLGDVRR